MNLSMIIVKLLKKKYIHFAMDFSVFSVTEIKLTYNLMIY